MKIVISGYYGSRNGGDEAILAAILEVLREMDGEMSATVISLNPEYTKKRHKVDAVKWLDVVGIARKILAADLLISGGGSLLQNVTSSRSLYYYLGIIFLAKILGRKVMLYAQGIGPIRGAFARKLMNLILNRVDLITVRDHGSLEELQNLKVNRPPMFCTADPVLAIRSVPLEFGKKILAQYDIQDDKKIIGVSVRRWIDWENCQVALAAALDKLVDELDAKIIFIPMQFPGDIQAAKSIAELMKNPCAVPETEFSTGEILSLVGCTNVLISIRLHALIFAGVMSVPMLGISYDPKIDRFLDSIGEKPIGNLDDITAEKIFSETIKKLDANNFHDESLLQNLRELALQNAMLAIELLKK